MKVIHHPCYNTTYDLGSVLFKVWTDNKTKQPLANVELKDGGAIIAVPLYELSIQYINNGKCCSWFDEELQESLKVTLKGIDVEFTFSWDGEEPQVVTVPHVDFMSFLYEIGKVQRISREARYRMAKKRKQNLKKNFFKNLLTLPNETCKFIYTHFSK